MTSIAELKEIKLHDLKEKSPTELLGIAEELEIENASALRRQEPYAILKTAARDVSIIGEGVVEICDGFGFLRRLMRITARPRDIYVSLSQIRRFGTCTGDTVDGDIRSPGGRALFRPAQGQHDHLEDPDKTRHKIHFDNLTPLYPDERLEMEVNDPTKKDMSARVIDGGAARRASAA
jgi:transcription termination factor Rho